MHHRDNWEMEITLLSLWSVGMTSYISPGSPVGLKGMEMAALGRITPSAACKSDRAAF